MYPILKRYPSKWIICIENWQYNHR